MTRSALALLLGACTLTPARAAEPVVTIRVAYSRSADVFHLLDNLAGCWSFSRPEYRAEWDKRFGLTAKDKELISRFCALRTRLYDEPAMGEELAPAKSPHGLFAYDDIKANPDGFATRAGSLCRDMAKAAKIMEQNSAGLRAPAAAVPLPASRGLTPS